MRVSRRGAVADPPTWHTGTVTTAPEPATGTLTEVEETTEYRLDDGDHERFSHYVPKDKLMQAMVDGIPVRALCGKMWVPSRDPKRFPVCPECKRIYEEDLVPDPTGE